MSRRNKRKTKKLQKKYWGIVSAKQLQKKKMRVFRKKNKLDRKAVEIAKKIHHDPYRADNEDNNKTIKVDTCSLWDMYADYNLQVMKCLLSVIRKAIVDGFPIENTYLHEIPYWDKELLIADFVNKDDFDDYHWHKKDVNIRCIGFFCYYDRKFAQPTKDIMKDGIVTMCEVKTCQEAVSIYGAEDGEEVLIN